MAPCTCARTAAASRAALIISVLALIASTTGIAFAATGKAVILGGANRATSATSITSSKGVALNLRVGAGRPPLAVNSSGRVANLNADTVDGIEGKDLAMKADLPPSLSGYTIMVAGRTCPTGSDPVGLAGNYGAEDQAAAGFGEYLYQVTDDGFGSRLTRARSPLVMSACRVH